MPKRSRSGVVSKPVRVVAPTSVKRARSIFTLRAAGPSDADLDRLHEQYTAEALASGVFGAPSYVLPSGEIFWGQDRLELLDRELGKK